MTIRQIANDLKKRGTSYWIRVICIACVGLFCNFWLTSHPPQWALDLRLRAYQLLSSSVARKAQLGHLAIVEISDNEYWKGELAGRKPIKRNYIAKLIQALCNDGAHAIAFDFDMRSPTQDGSLKNHPDYKAETDILAQEIQDASRQCKIILPRTINCPHPPDGQCTKEDSVLDLYSFDTNQVSWGYINLPTDIRQIPFRRENVESGTIESFAQAVAIADSPNLRKVKLSGSFNYGTFIPVDSFTYGETIFRARDILADSSREFATMISGKTVLIGGSWHSWAFERGPVIDAHLSPVGQIPGVFLHTNYAAALVDNRTYGSAGEVFGGIVDVTVVTIVALISSLRMRWWRRWRWMGYVALSLSIISYVLWQNFGMFLEVTIPIILLLVHAGFDEYQKMREELLDLRAKVAGAATSNPART
jgi:CHASE2 domain-containing sensor protein